MAINARVESIPQWITPGRAFYLGCIGSVGDEYFIQWLDSSLVCECSDPVTDLEFLVFEDIAPPAMWKSRRKVLRFVISLEDECPEWYQHLVHPFFDAVIEEVLTEPLYPEMNYDHSGVTNARVHFRRMSFEFHVDKGVPPDEANYRLGIFEDPNYPFNLRMTLAPGTWNAKLHHLSQPVKRNGLIKRTEIRWKGESSIRGIASNGFTQPAEISIASTQDHESDQTTRSWLQNAAAHCFDTGRDQRSTQVLANESSDLDPGSKALLIPNSASKSGSSALEVDAIPIGSDEPTCGDFADSDIYCSTELHGRLSIEGDTRMVSDRLDRANRTTEQTREGTNDSGDTQPTVQPQTTGQPHAEKQADQTTCLNNQTWISEQSWEVFDDGNTTQSPTPDTTTRDTSPAPKRPRITEPSQRLSNNRRVQPPQSDHGDLNSSEHIDLSRTILQMINNARSIGHARFLSRRHYDESKILIKRFVGRHAVPMMLDDDGPKNHLVVMEELRAMKRAIELLTGHW
ncbi:hypothetical protein D6D22_09299 [Aureobasidium pullulans]|nr:hypothetical protein D6D22_09299 [Aureobasidium pullulans]